MHSSRLSAFKRFSPLPALRRSIYAVLVLALMATGMSAFVASPERVPLFVLAGSAVTALLLLVLYWKDLALATGEAREFRRTRQTVAAHAERLRILHEIDRAVADNKAPEEIAARALQPLRELLGVPRTVINLFDLAAGEVEWLAAAGRHRVHLGQGVRYSLRFMGDIEALKRGEPQIINTHDLPAGAEVDALLASDVRVYMVIPMITGGELIGALSFGGPSGQFSPEQAVIATEVATQFAIAITQARLYAQVKHHADALEDKVRERTRELHAAHTELQQANAQLQAANKELEAFSYSVSHDLRAPLRGIAGFSQALSDDYHDRLDADGQDYLRRIGAAARRMGLLIDDMLQLAQVSRAELRRECLDLSDLARSVVEELRNGEPGRKVRVDIQEGLAVDADNRLMRALLDNLLGNAWKFTAKKADAHIVFGAESRGERLAYFVRDNGAGFDMTYADKLFRPFQRLHSESQFTGTGIGLATVWRIVTRHGGSAWAEGVVDAGAAFFFTLPLPEASRLTPDTSGSVATRGG